MIERDAFPRLDVGDLTLLAGVGHHQKVQPGDLLYQAGDHAYDFFVVLTGAVDMVLGDDRSGGERTLARHTSGQFVGEFGLLTNQPALLSARVAAAGEVLRVPATEAKHLISHHPQPGDTILNAFMARRTLLLDGARSSLRLIGSRYCPTTLAVREFLSRSYVPHEWIDPEHDPDAAGQVHAAHSASKLPIVVTASGVLSQVTASSLAHHLGLDFTGTTDERVFDLVIVGSGPAGLAAAVYGASEGLDTLCTERLAYGGQAGTSSRIENYLGFPTGVSGSQLVQRAQVQAEKFGARLTSPNAATSLHTDAGKFAVQLADGAQVRARAVIIATGARYRRLPVPQLSSLEGTGVYYAATELEARACSGGRVVVVGGGNSAGQAALLLADSGCEVVVVIRGSDLSASMSQYLSDRIRSHSRISLRTASKIAALHGGPELDSVAIESVSGSEHLACVGLFSFIGAEPASDWLPEDVARDCAGFVLTDRALRPSMLDQRWTTLGRQPLPFETNQPGLFAAGDVRSGSMKRVAAAVGEGSSAVQSVHQYLAFRH